MTFQLVEAGELMARRNGSVDPAKFPDEEFELHSIPAFDAGRPDVLRGSQIGSSKQVVQPDDVMISKIVPHIRRSSVVGTTSGKRQIASGEWIVFRSERVFPHYLRHLLVSDEFNAKFMSTVSGVGGSLLRARPAEVAKIKIPLPPLPEQRRIATILDKADALRVKRREAVAKLDQLLKSVFLDMFGDPDSSEFPISTLDEVCTKITDGAHFTPAYVEEGVAFLRVTDIQSESIGWNAVKRIPLAEHEELIKRCYPERGDVLYSKNGTIGIPKLVNWDEPFSIFVSLCLLKPDQSLVRGEYLESFLRTPFAVKQAIGRSKTGTVTNLHLVEIRKVRVPLPPLALQHKWIAVRRAFEAQRSRHVRSMRGLDQMIASLQQKAFSGTF